MLTEVKLMDILLTGTRHRDRHLNRNSPGQTGSYGRSNLNQNLKPKPKSNFRFIKTICYSFFSPKATPPPKSAAPGHCSPRPPLSGPCHHQVKLPANNDQKPTHRDKQGISRLTVSKEGLDNSKEIFDKPSQESCHK